MNKLLKRILCALVLTVFSVVSAYSADPQPSSSGNSRALNVRISQIVEKKYPKMRVYVSVSNDQNSIVPGLDGEKFKFIIDNGNIPVGSAKASIFSNTNEGVNYNIIFPTNLQKATMNIQATAILNFVDGITNKDKISIYTMADTVSPICVDVLKDDFQQDKISTYEGVTDAAPKIYDSINSLIRSVAKKPDDRKVIIIVSDERDNSSIIPAKQFMNTVEQANIPIYTIGIRPPNTSTQVRMEDISYASNGEYFYTPMIRDLSSTLTRIIDIVVNSYVLDFKVKTNFIEALRGGDGNTHSLNLQIDIRDGFGTSSKNFIAIKKSVPLYAWIALGVIIALFIIFVAFASIISKKRTREAIGITDRVCPDCGSRLRDSWDECPFCKYLPDYLESLQAEAERASNSLDLKSSFNRAKGASKDLSGKAKDGLGKAKEGLGKAKGGIGKAKGGLGKLKGGLGKISAAKGLLK